ncbi:hypothetical protein [Amycolatopsis balhimycina]|uniref:hypothetical protein n=1 Tax=Amycolatopsis balhimycina TaxID=208443 RepID=UPI00163CC059|nr:hypothetical protein [Amycolatopsis balhimycina]
MWRLDGPVGLGRVPDQYRARAYETLTGIAVATSPGPGELVRWDGTVERLPVDLGTHPVRSADGRFLAGVEHPVGRRSWDRHHLLDVTTGDVARLPRTDDLTHQVLAVHDETVYYRQAFVTGSRAFRWHPGTDPEPLIADPWQMDSQSGATLAADDEGTIWRTPTGNGSRCRPTAGTDWPPAASDCLRSGTTHRRPGCCKQGQANYEQPLSDGCDTSAAILAAPFWEPPPRWCSTTNAAAEPWPALVLAGHRKLEPRTCGSNLFEVIKELLDVIISDESSEPDRCFRRDHLTIPARTSTRTRSGPRLSCRRSTRSQTSRSRSASPRVKTRTRSRRDSTPAGLPLRSTNKRRTHHRAKLDLLRKRVILA